MGTGMRDNMGTMKERIKLEEDSCQLRGRVGLGVCQWFWLEFREVTGGMGYLWLREEKKDGHGKETR